METDGNGGKYLVIERNGGSMDGGLISLFLMLVRKRLCVVQKVSSL